ncbi:MAG: hypothetical protein AB8B69_08285 [Chitinophagales bacterium]
MELLSFYSYAIASILTILIGLVYATRKTIMPYHLKALEKTWEEIDVNSQLMLNSLLNGGGFYGISCGIFMLVLLLIPFSEGQLWAGYTIGLAGLVGTLPLTYIVYKVKTRTKGDPPLWVMIVVDVLLIVGLLGVVLS